ncbi:CocE/NonD family hydrolase [Azospirillum sp. SYSU D00513]|uniref:CocE/NonD family hydrolase n=1 Tax=Azospirillum sp. SYSU D00513 TaxID=2812561 RepID=UPI001A960557|nr:CocE/NonD family hydrolase [Azospirillum sp. SYSU D00513]
MNTTAAVLAEAPAPFPVRPPETVSMRARDGARLDADVYRPDAAGSWPVLLLRVNCGRRTAQNSHYAHPRWYASRGYVVAVQDVRGCGTSEGRFRPFQAEREDGADAVAWAATLPGSSGVVGMYGCGYAGMAQLLALAGQPEGKAPQALRAVAPALAGWDIFSDWAYEGGAFRLAEAMEWALRCGAEAARRVEDGAAYRGLLKAVRDLPLNDEIPSRPRVLREYARHTHYDDWLTTPGPGGEWDDHSPAARLRGSPAGVPVLQIGGWFDGRLGGTLDAHAAFSSAFGAPARLVVGPWMAGGWHLPAGEPEAPDERPSIDALQLAWFDRFLKGIDNGADREPPVRLHDLAAGRWRGLPVLPEPNAEFHLGGDGMSATHGDGGRLAPEPPSTPGVDALVHDPRLPVPSLGGHTAPCPGLHDRAALDARPDVAVYDTAPLAKALPLAGRVALELCVEADAPSFDVNAVLSMVRPDGRALPLTSGHVRVEPGAPTRPLSIPMRAACATLEPGCRLRLSLAGSSFPAHPVNPGTGAEPGETRLVDALPVTLLIHTGGPRASRLRLALAEG